MNNIKGPIRKAAEEITNILSPPTPQDGVWTQEIQDHLVEGVADLIRAHLRECSGDELLQDIDP